MNIDMLKVPALVVAGAVYIAWILAVVNLLALIIAIVTSTAIMLPFKLMSIKYTGETMEQALIDFTWSVFGAITLIGIVETFIRVIS